MRTPSIVLLVGLVLFAVAMLVFRRSDGGSVPIWRSGSMRSRAGLAAWLLSLAFIAAGLVLVFRDG